MNLLTGKSALVGLGFALGTLGVKALSSKTAKELYVKGLAEGIKFKHAAEELVERAKENVDDIVAEAEELADKKIAEKVVVPAETE